MSKLLVTGCAGFVGSWICQKALDKGYEVIGIDNLSSGVNFTLPNVKFIQADLNSDISSFISDVDAIVHAAAFAELRHNWKDKKERERLFLNNEMATRSLLEQMPDVPIVFLSSASVYGSKSQKVNRPLIEEDAIPDTIESPYAASKMACETYVSAWAYKKQIRWYSIRLVNQVGSRGHRGVIADFCKMAKNNKHIHAADNGKQIKNWVSVEDTADAIMTLLDESNNVPSGIYTITSNERWSWRDIVNVMNSMYHEKYPNSEDPFTLSFEERMAGAIGDPVNLYVTGDKLKPYYVCNRSVEKSVRDALKFIGWV
jgi:UDP-glucose 4-epimerase